MQASSFGNYIIEEAFKNSFVQQSQSDLSESKSLLRSLAASTDRTDSAPFIEFILQMILDAILSSNDAAQASDHVTAQASVQVSDHVQRLISLLGQDDYTLAELM